ncbi:helix-turn-helix domain-containing protein, partial [Microcoleus sp. SVA1_B6]
MNIFRISYKTLYNWFNRWESEGMIGLYNKPGRGAKSLFDSSQKAQIKEWAQQQGKRIMSTSGNFTVLVATIIDSCSL